MDNPKRLVLIVEDDSDDYLLAKDALKETCPEVEQLWAKDGEEALNYVNDPKNALPSLIFLDLNMPKIDGWEYLNEIRKDDRLKHIPVVILTNSSSPEDVMRAYRSGANNFVRKPSGYKELVKFLHTFRMYWFEYSKLPK